MPPGAPVNRKRRARLRFRFTLSDSENLEPPTRIYKPDKTYEFEYTRRQDGIVTAGTSSTTFAMTIGNALPTAGPLLLIMKNLDEDNYVDLSFRTLAQLGTTIATRIYPKRWVVIPDLVTTGAEPTLQADTAAVIMKYWIFGFGATDLVV